MIVTCPSCSTEFYIPLEIAGADRRRLRCSHCAHVWRYRPPEPEFEPAPPQFNETPAFLQDVVAPQNDSFANVLKDTAVKEGIKLPDAKPRQKWFRLDGHGPYGYAAAAGLMLFMVLGYYIFAARPHPTIPPITIEQIKMLRTESSDGVVKIRIEGELPNRGQDIEPILPIKVTLLGDNERGVVATWVFQPTIRSLSPGTVATFFTSRMIAKPDDVKQVEIRFLIPASR